MTAGARRGAQYQLRSFRAGRAGDRANAETTAWSEAEALGFLQPAPSAEHLLRTVGVYEADDRVLTGAYAADHPTRAWETLRPVATYATFKKPLNVGGGNVLDAHLIASVTVRANHRRQGLMRELICADLLQAREDGTAIAALSSMEATIYGRFGFGPATFTRRVEVDTSERFSLKMRVAGSVEITDPSTLLDLAPIVFDRFHAQTMGSVQRPASYPSKIAGIWAEDKAESDDGMRAALHYDPTGNIDGYVTYRFLGWETQPGTIAIVDIVWTSQNAYFGLWDYLASIDLVTRVTFGQASMSDSLPWAMVDRRGFKTVGEEDGLWLRVLDPVVALQARNYDVDGELRIALSDSLAIADGVYTLSVRRGEATVTADKAKGAVFDVAMDIATLGSLYLGGVRVSSLAGTGQIVSHSAEAVETLDVLLAHKEPPYCITHF